MSGCELEQTIFWLDIGKKLFHWVYLSTGVISQWKYDSRRFSVLNYTKHWTTLLNLVLILLYASGSTMDFPKVPCNLNDYMILWNQNLVNASYGLQQCISINCMGYILIHLGASNDCFLKKSDEVSKCTSQAYLRNKIPLHSLKLWGQTESIFLCWFWKACKLLIMCSPLIYIYICVSCIFLKNNGIKVSELGASLACDRYTHEIPKISHTNHTPVVAQCVELQQKNVIPEREAWSCFSGSWHCCWNASSSLGASGAHHCLSHYQAVVPEGADCHCN